MVALPRLVVAAPSTGQGKTTIATGLGVILHLHRRATRAQRQLLLIDPSERTTRLLRGCRLDRILAARPAR